MLPRQKISWRTHRTESWRNNSKNAQVLHVFDNSCNLKNEAGQVLSIVNPGIGRGPFNLVLQENLNFPAFFSASSAVSLKNGLVVGQHEFESHTGTIWDPGPPWISGKSLEIAHSLQYITAAARQYPIKTDIVDGLHGNKTSENDLIYLTKRLAGRGPGLTPSGDDYLVGLMHAFWLCLPPHQARSLGHLVVGAARGRTTTLSLAWLSCAAVGEAGEAWHDLILAIRKKHPVGIENAAAKILAAGHSSGVDAISGFIDGLQALD